MRFSVTAKGGIVSIGNTLGLAKQTGANGPGTRDSIGTFLTPDPLLIDNQPANPGNPWSAGTTWDWQLNSSSAVLELPEDSSGIEILYAELVWGGSYLHGAEDVSAHLGVAVTLAANGMTFDAVPSPQTAVTLAEIGGGGLEINYYMRSAEVTEFVADQLSATFTVTGVPATQDSSVDTLNAAGWSLVVVYRTSHASIRNLSVFVGGQFVDEGATVDYLVSGFCTPPQGKVEAVAVISALEGDAHRTGDTFQIAATGQGPFAQLSGPNNPANNFFASQVNGGDGMIDPLGSSGDANHDALAGQNVVGGRQGWDVTTVALSSANNQLSNGQTSAVLRAVTTDDSFMPVLAGLAIDVSAPDFEGSTAVEVAPLLIGVGEQSTITMTLVNEGEVGATALWFTAPLGQGLELVSFSLDDVPGDANQQPVDTADLVTGVELGDMGPGVGRTVTMVVQAVGKPKLPDGWFIPAIWTFDYVTCVGQDPLSEQSFAFVDIGFAGGGEDEGGGDGDGDGDGSGDGDGDGEPAETGGADAGTGTDGGGGGGESGDGAGTGFGDGTGGAGLGESDGCNCQSDGPPTSLLGLAGLLGLLGLRRRRPA
ncbi:putative internalin [Enhygromyxa salina]|uniref:Putative internalin n=1 Tax=Enhygromyxa salina TaxID=215803 RepID=A0A0C2CQT6_9BACT|nr:putative internalin [Enhygromyxa salina]